ncbi:hypothetical protein E4U38_005506 [Claviceps purpurea]|nr:hypothetical protein E4U38_005506 [Claviceps purpurea]
MKSHSFLFSGALLCNAVAAFHIPYFRSPSLWQADATATGPDRKPPSCLDGGPDDVTLYNTSLPSKRSLDDSCGSNRTLVEQAYKDCATMARAGERVARAKNSVSSALLKGIFKDDSDKTRNHVAEHLATIAVECEKNGEGLTPVGSGILPESGEDNNKGNGNSNNNGNGNGNDGDNEKGKPKPSAGRQGGSGNMPNSSSKGRPSGESLGGEQDGDYSHTEDHDGPCPYRNTIAPHSAVIATAAPRSDPGDPRLLSPQQDCQDPESGPDALWVVISV